MPRLSIEHCNSVTFASDSDSYMCLLHRAGAHCIPRMGGLYPPQAKVEMGIIGMECGISDIVSDSYMCLLHRTGAHWIPRMGGLYPPQAKV